VRLLYSTRHLLQLAELHFTEFDTARGGDGSGSASASQKYGHATSPTSSGVYFAGGSQGNLATEKYSMLFNLILRKESGIVINFWDNSQTLLLVTNFCAVRFSVPETCYTNYSLQCRRHPLLRGLQLQLR